MIWPSIHPLVSVVVLSDHPSNNSKRDGVWIYYKSALPLRALNIYFLQESISFELKIDDRLCNFFSLYRSSSQTQGKFEKFSENLERNLDRLFQNNPFLVVVIGISLLNQATGINITNPAQTIMQLIL